MRVFIILIVIMNYASPAQDLLIVELEDGTVYSCPAGEISKISFSGIPVSINEQELMGKAFRSFTMYQNYPNPFNPSTTIRYEIPRPGLVDVNIYDVRGALVRSFGSMQQEHGIHTITWDGRNDNGAAVSSGTYFCRIRFNESCLTNKLLLLK